MEIGIVHIVDGRPGRGLEFAQQCAEVVEAVGFASIWAPDHVAFFDEYASKYPHSDSGKFKFTPDQGHIDSLQVLLAIALVTERLRIGPSVEVLPLRNPLIRAREIAALDQYSKGRVQYGIGIGWKREEFEAAGVPFEQRGPRTDHYLAAMKELWTAQRATYESEFVSFRDVIMFPKPEQRPYPPVLVGGITRPAARRAARHGDGWYGWKMTPEELAEFLVVLDEELAAAGRDRDGFRIVLGAPHSEALVEELGRFERLGVDEFVLGLSLSRQRFAEQLEGHALATKQWLTG